MKTEFRDPYNERTPIINAAFGAPAESLTDILSFLIENGADVNACDINKGRFFLKPDFKKIILSFKNQENKFVFNELFQN